MRADVSADYLRASEAISTTAITEILATNFPLPKLKPPPVRKTISAIALERLHSAQTIKELKKLEEHQKRGSGKEHH